MRVWRVIAGGIGLALLASAQPGEGRAATPTAASAPASVELLSHRAAYRLQLDRADQQSGISAIQGGLVVEWRASCEGYISNQRLGFVAATTEGPGFSYDVRFSSVESNDLQNLRFAMRTFDDGDLSDEWRGFATLEAPGGPGKVSFDAPPADPLALPRGTIFPTQHVKALVAAARDGQRFLAHDVYDGSGEDGLNRVTAIIGEPVQGADGQASWPVNLAYYAPQASEAAPDFELAFKLDAGGVLRDVVLDYGEFSVRGALEKLERLPASSCD